LTCYHIVEEQHRGSIDVRSELGRGTTVTVRIPTDPSKHERRKTDRRRLSDV
jgi:signal transduction histidine kinase